MRCNLSFIKVLFLGTILFFIQCTSENINEIKKASATENISNSQVDSSLIKGKKLSQGCLTCHNTTYERKIGPGLAGTTSRHSMAWIIAFTKNSTDLIYSGDPEAVHLSNEYRGLSMPSHYLTDEEVKAIFKWIDSLNNKNK